MVGACTNNSDIDSVSLIPSSETVDDVDTISCVEIVDSAFPVDFPDLYESSYVSKALINAVCTST